jgi:hypothetical protein
MKWDCLTERKCVHIGIQQSEGHEPLLNVGKYDRKNNKVCLKENEYWVSLIRDEVQ